jgi:AraC-like DNA-binding protein
MRPKLEQIKSQQTDKSFHCYEVNAPSFEFYWHHHPEYELTLIVKGNGKRMVGDSIEQFSDGDIAFIGPMLPHTWVSHGNKKGKCSAVVIQFSETMIRPFLQLPEFEPVSALLKKTNTGVVFPYLKKQVGLQDFEIILHSKGIESLSNLMLLLSKLSSCKLKPLASARYQNTKKQVDTSRINKVLDYIQQHYSEPLHVVHAASLIHLSKSAFCKYFKRSMKKTFSDYVNDIRISEACVLLIESDKPIGQIALACGFENLAYFNRVFLKKKKMTPGSFRKQTKV